MSPEMNFLTTLTTLPKTPQPQQPTTSDLEKQLKEGFGKLDKRYEAQQQAAALSSAEARGRESARREQERREEVGRWERIERVLEGGGRGSESGSRGGNGGMVERERESGQVFHTVNLGAGRGGGGGYGGGCGGLLAGGRGSDRRVMGQFDGRVRRLEDDRYRYDEGREWERERERVGRCRSRSGCGECRCATRY